MLVAAFSPLHASDPWQFDPAAESSQIILESEGFIQSGPEKAPLTLSKLEASEEARTGLPALSGSEVYQDIGSGPVVVSELAESGESVKEPIRPEELEDFEEDEELEETISDPLEPVNRFFFHFNDKVYFWLLKPVARGYRAILPESMRVAVRNFFNNLAFPIHFVNCLLQGKFQGAGDEFTRFMVNTIVGAAGFYDVAGKNLNIKPQEEDFGQTLGFYGLGNGFYIHWPFIGPSSLRDSFGLAADIYTQPLNYAIEFKYNIGVRAYDRVNNTSLTIGDYESLKEAALDPYIAVRDAYYQYRKNRIED
jgi:phospholipid-binding lipoprotein MlaA